MDLTTYTDEELDGFRREVAIEQERRTTAAGAADQISSLVRTAEASGVSVADIHAAVEQGLTPEEAALLRDDTA